MMLDSIKSLGSLGKMPKPGEGSWTKPPSVSNIVIRPVEPGEREDPLEKRAMQGVPGSLPERIVWKWLEDSGHLYEVQQALFGGRRIAGGMVLDFYIYSIGGRPIALRVQGEYWHGPLGPGKKSKDDIQAFRLRARGYLVVDLWERDIYREALTGHLKRYIMRQIIG